LSALEEYSDKLNIESESNLKRGRELTGTFWENAASASTSESSSFEGSISTGEAIECQ